MLEEEKVAIDGKLIYYKGKQIKHNEEKHGPSNDVYERNQEIIMRSRSPIGYPELDSSQPK